MGSDACGWILSGTDLEYPDHNPSKTNTFQIPASRCTTNKDLATMNQIMSDFSGKDNHSDAHKGVDRPERPVTSQSWHSAIQVPVVPSTIQNLDSNNLETFMDEMFNLEGFFDDIELDQDAALLASEEAKLLTPKERRRLRNRVSARAFRQKRKDHIAKLEKDMALKFEEKQKLLNQNRELWQEYQGLQQLSIILLSSESFQDFSRKGA